MSLTRVSLINCVCFDGANEVDSDDECEQIVQTASIDEKPLTHHQTERLRIRLYIDVILDPINSIDSFSS